MGLRGAIAAAVTPMRDGGRHLDDEAFAPLVRSLVEGGIDGLLACGTTGEGVLLSVGERRRVAESFLAARPSGFQVAIHAGAQTTSDTVALAAHALDVGADAVAVIAPVLPARRRGAHPPLRTGGERVRPLPFYLYEFAGRSGYAIPIDVIARVRERSPNLRGLKVSDTPFSAVEPYLAIEGMDVFIGNEPLVLEGSGRSDRRGQRAGDGVPLHHGGAGARPERTRGRAGRTCSGPAPRDPVPRGHEGGAGREGRAVVSRCPSAAPRR